MLNELSNDFELWSAIRENDEAAFHLLFDRYWVRLYKTAYRHLKHKELCEEIVHDVFMNIWSRRQGLMIHSFPHFLTAAIRYQIHNHKRAAVLPLVRVEEHPEPDHAFELNRGIEQIRERELQTELNVYLERLPKRCQEIFQMSRIEHLSNQEIAGRLGISKRTVENQITFALKHLRLCFKHLVVIILLLVR